MHVYNVTYRPYPLPPTHYASRIFILLFHVGLSFSTFGMAGLCRACINIQYFNHAFLFPMWIRLITNLFLEKIYQGIVKFVKTFLIFDNFFFKMIYYYVFLRTYISKILPIFTQYLKGKRKIKRRSVYL